MKVLFICRANVGRSVIAEAIYNKYTSSKDASSAGTIAEEAGKTLKQHERTDFVLDVLDKEGINIRSHKIKRLTEKMVDNADKVIVLTDLESWPDYLKNNSKIEYWEIEDGKGKNLHFHEKMKDKIKQKIKELINKNDNKIK